MSPITQAVTQSAAVASAQGGGRGKNGHKRWIVGGKAWLGVRDRAVSVLMRMGLRNKQTGAVMTKEDLEKRLATVHYMALKTLVKKLSTLLAK